MCNILFDKGCLYEVSKMTSKISVKYPASKRQSREGAVKESWSYFGMVSRNRISLKGTFYNSYRSVLYEEEDKNKWIKMQRLNDSCQSCRKWFFFILLKFLVLLNLFKQYRELLSDLAHLDCLCSAGLTPCSG